MPFLENRNSLALKTSIRYGLFGGIMLLALLWGIQVDPTQVDITLLSGNIYLGDNKDGCSVEPQAAFVGFRICNTSSDTLYNLRASLRDFTSANYGLAGGQAEEQFIGRMLPGACKDLYWYTYFDCDNVGSSTEMTLYLYDGGPSEVTETITMTTTRSLTANAGGEVTNVTPGGSSVIGSVLEAEYEYSFGNLGKNSELIFQPAGNLDFDASCFRLLGAEVISSDVNAVPTGTTGKLHFHIPAKENGGSHTVRVKYYYANQCLDQETEARGYGASVSGNVYKHSNNIGDTSYNYTLPPSSNSLAIDKIADRWKADPGDTIVYEIRIGNTSDSYVSLDSVKDILPDGFSFVGMTDYSDVTLSNASTMPTANQTDTIRWIGGQDAAVYPYSELLIPPDDTILIAYKVYIDPLIQVGDYSNLAWGDVGTYQLPYVTAIVCVGETSCLLPVDWRYFELKPFRDKVLLRWQMDELERLASFVIERSWDGRNFTPLAEIRKENGAKTNKWFSYIDSIQRAGEVSKWYYRIAGVDHDGQKFYSDLRTWHQLVVGNRWYISLQDQASALWLFSEMSLRNEADLLIVDIQGRVMYHQHLPKLDTMGWKINTASWPSGIYYVSLSHPSWRESKAFIIP